MVGVQKDVREELTGRPAVVSTMADGRLFSFNITFCREREVKCLVPIHAQPTCFPFMTRVRVPKSIWFAFITILSIFFTFDVAKLTAVCGFLGF